MYFDNRSATKAVQIGNVDLCDAAFLQRVSTRRRYCIVIRQQVRANALLQACITTKAV